jgi:mannitol-1-phosphate 5-dehydrogenase
VRLVDGARAQDVDVSGVRCVPLADGAAVAGAVARADLVATTVGLENLPGIAAPLAAGCRARGRAPLNVLTFENGADPAGRLAGLLGGRRRLPDTIGVAGALAERIVSRRIGDPAGDEPLTFVADPAPGFVVDGRRLRAPLPDLPGMRITDDFRASVHRKLSMFSAGHAAAAYLGALKGYRYVHAAVRDREIHRAVTAVIREGQAGLDGQYGTDLAGGPAEVDRLMARFANAALDDQVDRVARDPLRKLAPGERIIGSAVLAEEAGVRPDALALVAAAALCFLRRLGGQEAVDHILTRVCGLSLHCGLGARVRTAYLGLLPGILPANPLLDVEQRLWAVAGHPVTA